MISCPAGRTDGSIMLYRMSSVEPEERMPEIGRTLVHEEEGGADQGVDRVAGERFL